VFTVNKYALEVWNVKMFVIILQLKLFWQMTYCFCIFIFLYLILLLLMMQFHLP